VVQQELVHDLARAHADVLIAELEGVSGINLNLGWQDLNK